MMSRKSKGIGAERDLVHRFWATGTWVAHRIAGSGSSRYPSPDIIASNNLRRLVVECKCSKDKSIYIPKKEIDELRKFGDMFGAESWLAIKFNKEEWLFLALEDLHETPSSFSMNIEHARLRGLLFEEIIK